MRLSRALEKFANTPILYWDPIGYEWLDSGLRCRLQSYDRFISERTFGQKKRILTLADRVTIPDEQNIVRLGDSEVVFMVESYNEDISGEEVYGSYYQIHESPFQIQVCKRATTAARSGARLDAGELVLAETWADIERFSTGDSREFSNTDYTTFTLTLPRGTPLDTDSYIRRLDTGEILDINEIFQGLDLPVARGQRRG